MSHGHDLSQLDNGQEVAIRSVAGHSTLRQRLQELGFTPGATVRLVAKAAFGGAMAFQVRGSTIALRRADAACVEF
ncbi:MAG: FeoA domain [Fibrobacterota bacterium]|jgi:ferrous iron transport protein A